MMKNLVYINPNWNIKIRRNLLKCTDNQGNSYYFRKENSKISYLIINILSEFKKGDKDINFLISKILIILPEARIKKIKLVIYDLVRQGLIVLDTKRHGITRGENERYFRQLRFWNQFQNESEDVFDIQGKLKQTTVSIVGLGGQGSIVATYLGAVGIGHLILIDGDCIESSNLSRQVFYTHKDIGKNKAHILSKYISKQNRFISVKAVQKFISQKDDVAKYLKGSDFVVLCGDRPMVKLREWINSYAVSNNIPHIGVSGSWVGPLCVPGISACYECEKTLYRKKYKQYDEVVNWIKTRTETKHRPAFVFRPSLSGLMIAQQVVKYLSGVMNVETLKGRWRLNLNLVSYFENIPRNKKCKICGNKK